jgi:hypothetical protein
MRPTFEVAIANPDALVAARDAANVAGSPLILDNLTPPPHPTHSTFGSLKDKLRDLDAREGLLESEDVSDDGRHIRLIFWSEVSSEEEARIVGALAYWSACWSARLPLPIAGGVEVVEP